MILKGGTPIFIPTNTVQEFLCPCAFINTVGCFIFAHLTGEKYCVIVFIWISLGNKLEHLFTCLKVIFWVIISINLTVMPFSIFLFESMVFFIFIFDSITNLYKLRNGPFSYVWHIFPWFNFVYVLLFHSEILNFLCNKILHVL